MKKIFFLCIFMVLTLTAFAQNAATAEDYALTYFKHINQTQTKLTYMNKKNTLAKVGTETIKGDISGTLFYDVKIKGVGAVVTLRYTNYCDEEGWIFDGEIITHSTMVQNGNFGGVVKVSGVAPGEVRYDKVRLIKGNPGDGNYIVTISGKTAEEVSYKIYLKSKE